jgi:hypothetical protein
VTVKDKPSILRATLFHKIRAYIVIAQIRPGREEKKEEVPSILSGGDGIHNRKTAPLASWRAESVTLSGRSYKALFQSV